jgi:hypothetical protein
MPFCSYSVGSSAGPNCSVDTEASLSGMWSWSLICRLRLKCDGTRAETRFRLSAKRTSPFKLAAASVQSTAGSRGVRLGGGNGSNAGYTMFRGSVRSTGYPLHSPVSPSLPLPFFTVCHHISAGLYPVWRPRNQWHAQRFPWHGSALWRICVYIRISDCEYIVYELPLLWNNTASETFLHTSERCEVLTGYLSLGRRSGGVRAYAWHWAERFTVCFWNRKW